MLCFLDTNVLISYAFSSEKRHQKVRATLEELKAKDYKFYISSYTFLELSNTICRIMVGGCHKLADEFEEVLVPLLKKFKSPEDKCKFITFLIIGLITEKLGLEMVDFKELYDFSTLKLNKEEVDLPKIFAESLNLSSKLRIRIKDLLHIAYVDALFKGHKGKVFLTCDVENFERVKNVIEKDLKFEVRLIG